MSLVDARIAERIRWIAAERVYLAAEHDPMKVEYHKNEIAELENVILLFQRYDLIARLCIVKDLPAGDPAWMAKLICSFIKPPPEEEDDHDGLHACGCCRR